MTITHAGLGQLKTSIAYGMNLSDGYYFNSDI